MPKALIVEILADAKQFGAELDRAAGKTRSFGKAAGVAGLALGGALAYGMEKSVKSATQFQSSMTLLSTQAGVATNQVKGLSQGVLALAGPTATAPDELAKGIYHLASQGLRGKQALDALRIAAEGAKVGQANLEDVTNALGATIAARVKGVSNLRQAMGELNATVGAGDMRMQDLADAMGTGLASNAAIARVSLKDVSAALAVFGDNNIRGAKAGTALGSVLRLMSAPSAAAAKALATIGIGATDLATKMAGPGGLPSAIKLLKDRMDAMGLSAVQQSALLTTAFGGKQATGVKLLIDEFGRLQNKEREVGAGASGFGAAWNQTTDTAAFKMQQFRAAMDSVGISLGSVLLPALTSVAGGLATMAGYLARHTTLAKILVGAVGALAAGLIALSVATWAVNVAMDANPIGLVIVALAALAVGLKIAWDHSQTFRNVVRATWADVKAVTSATVAILKPLVVGLIDIWVTEFKIAKSIATHMWDGIKAAWDGSIGSAIRGIIHLIQTLIGWIEKAMGAINGLIHAAGHIHIPGSGILHDITSHIPSIPFGGPLVTDTGGGRLPLFTSTLGVSSPSASAPASSGGGGLHIHVGPINGTADTAFARTLASELATQLRGGRVPQLQQAIKAI